MAMQGGESLAKFSRIYIIPIIIQVSFHSHQESVLKKPMASNELTTHKTNTQLSKENFPL